MKKNDSGTLLSLLSSLLKEASTSKKNNDYESIDFSIIGKAIAVLAPSKRAFTKILSSAFFGNVNGKKTDIEIVIFESIDEQFVQALNIKDQEGNLLLREYSDEQFVVIDRSWNAIYFLDRSQGIGGVWAQDVEKVSLASFITPLRTLLSWCIEDERAELVHAAGVEIENKGILLTGPSGSGKSTLALYAALNGHGILGDDAVIVHAGKMKAIYQNAKVDKYKNLLNVDERRRINLNGVGISKDILPLTNNGFNFLSESELKAVVLPSVGQKTQWTKMKKIDAIKEFMPQTTKELLGGTNQNVKNLLGIVNNFPFFKLELSGNLEENLLALKSISAES